MKNWIQSTFLLSTLSLFISPLYAYVGPVLPGQSQWCITARIGSSLDIIESKLCAVDIGMLDIEVSLLQETLCSKIELIQDNDLIAESKLDLTNIIIDELKLCMPIGIMGTTTISAPGIYCVGINFTGSITIDASDVELNVNNHTINGFIEITSSQSNITLYDGTIESAGDTDAIKADTGGSNVVIQNITAKNGIVGINFDQVTSGLIQGCTLTQNSTGMQLYVSQKIVIEDTVAECNRYAGFDIINSATNSFSDCKALTTGDGNSNVLDNNVFGFVATSGSENIFERCIANATQALSTTDYNSVVAGIALRGTESCSKIIECEAANSTTNANGVTVPYGILLQKTVNEELMLTASTVLSGKTRSVSWSPDGKFFAAAEFSTPNRLFVFNFDRVRSIVTEQAVTTINSDALAALDWSPAYDYIAVADSTANDIVIFKFERTNNTLTLVCRADVKPGNPVAIEWRLDGRYLAVVDTVGTALLVYEFDSVKETLSLVATDATLGTPVSVGWRADGNYLVVADSGDNIVIVFLFESATNTLVQQASTSIPSNPVAVDWSPDGKFIAVGDTVDNEIFICEFDSLANTITIIATADRKPTDVQSVVWSPDSRFVAVPDNPAGSPPFGSTILVYEFNRGSDTLLLSTRIEHNVPDGPLEADWNPDGQHILLADDQGPNINLYIYQVMTFPSKNVVTNNTVYCNSGGACPQGVGISGSSIANLIIQNTAYANPLMPFAGIGTNYEFVTNVFNQQFGQAPTLLQNISLNCDEPVCMQEDIALTLKQTLSKSCQLVEAGLPGLSSVIDSILTLSFGMPCNATPITAPTTITASGNYCLAQDISGSTPITIQASNVTLDLNNYVVSATAGNAINIAGGVDCIAIANGTLQETGLGQTLYVVNVGTNSSQITFENINFKGALQGLTFNGSTVGGLVKSCKFEQNQAGLAVFIHRTL